MEKWVLLHYKIPPEPSAPRVYIWRKLKRIGAILYQDAIWVLPNNPHTREQFQWLATEIGEQGGEATFWVADPGLKVQEELLIQGFAEQADRAYAEILEKLQDGEPDLGSLSRQYQLAKTRDYFHSEVGRRVREKLLSARGGEV